MPTLERPDAEARRGRAAAHDCVDWPDGADPYAAASGLLRPDGRYGVSDSAWAMHLLGLQRALPGTRYDCADRRACRCCARSRTPTSWPGWRRPARPPTPTYERDRQACASPAGGRPTSRPTSPGCCASYGHEQVDFTVVGSGPNGANPHHEAGDRVIEDGDVVVLDFGGLMYGYGSDTTRTVCVGEPSRRDARGARDRAAGPAGGVRGGPARRRLPGDRPGGAGGDHRRRLRRAVHPPHRPRHRRRPPTSRRTWSRARSSRSCPGCASPIEPGIYLAGRFGVRIEDIVTVTGDGGRRLNNTDHGPRTCCRS